MLRCFTKKAITGNGVGEKTLEQRVTHELKKLLREFCKKEEDGNPFFPMELFHKAVTNIMNSIVFGCR